MLGRRGSMLLIMGLVYIVLGLGVSLGRPGPHAARFNIVYNSPAWIWIGAWALSGVVACVYAFKARDAVGWSTLYVMPMVTIVAYLVKLGFDISDRTGYYLAWYDALLFTPFVAIVLVCSGWEENHRVSELSA